MNHIDVKYLGILSVRLPGYTVKNNHPYKATCRCPICGDSQKSKTKTRGWFVEKSKAVLYHCFNCGVSHPLWRFLKVVEPTLYNDYVIDTRFEKISDHPKEPKPLDLLTAPIAKVKKSGSPVLKLKRVSQLDPKHPVKQYVMNRQIPTHMHYRLYYAPKFGTWVNSLIPSKLDLTRDQPRLVLPFFDENGEMFGFQGRAFDPKALRYITIMLDESKPKLFGLDKVDFTKRYYIVEGPIDSLFLPNCIAMAGADGKQDGLERVQNAVLVYDNEPRNVDIVNRMRKALEAGHSVCIWPSKVDAKDINDMILAGYTQDDLVKLIDENTYKGLAGILALADWRRC